jgi:nondiscriminating glutamyl-tRNA synthetase
MTNQELIRVRFAPSPTGYLHIGGARTALYNWLFARAHKGTFILRIEDTDRTRSSEEAVKAILDGMEWLGLNWDEGPGVGGDFGPYFQTARLKTYQEWSKRLIEMDKAYYCFCTSEELTEQRRIAAEKKEAPKYNAKCRNLPKAETEKLLKSGKPYVIRFRLPETGVTMVDDIIRGDVSFENEVLDDFVIMKSDGFPTYNFAAVVDDHLMKISHVIRGDDHLSNTPRQILLYMAFGLTPPKFAHIPMIMGADRARLSKRHGATSVIDYKTLGYLPEAMTNYIARLGWGHKDQEIFSRQELIEKFELNRVSKTPAIFDMKKLEWLNAHYIKTAPAEKILELCMPLLEKAYPNLDKNYAKRVVKCLQDRLKLITDIVPLSEYFFKDDYSIDQAVIAKYVDKPGAKELISKLRKKLETSDFTHDKLEANFKDVVAESMVKLGEIIHPTRALLSGRAETPGIYDIIEVLGKEKTIKRLSAI